MATRIIAFLGDIVGQPGRRAVEQQLPLLIAQYKPDTVIANAENARSGSGLSTAIYTKLREHGIHAITLGDHALRDPRIGPVLEAPHEPICRPANISKKAPGKRYVRLPPPPGFARETVIFTLLGRIYFPLPADDPFACADDILVETAARNPIVLVEAHMEATSEKIALANHVRGRVAAVLGSHTHVPTADARVLVGGTAFITDVGMCGPYDSVIGRDTESVLRHMTTAQHVPYPLASHDARVCGAVVRVSEETGLALSIERVEFAADHSRPPFNEPSTRQ
jgi:metallophosphoesterase (TIGR00282 family)